MPIMNLTQSLSHSSATDHPQTSQIGGPAPAGRGVVGGGTNHTATATAPGAAPTAQTTQPGGTYV